MSTLTRVLAAANESTGLLERPDHEIQIDVSIRQAETMPGRESRQELERDHGYVVAAKTKRNQRAGIADFGLTDIGLKLPQVLMRRGRLPSRQVPLNWLPA
jgi:hypothetical protein